MIASLTLFAALAVTPAPEVNPDRFLAAVREVAQTEKTPLGPFDLTPIVWEHQAPLAWPYAYARREAYARAVAKKHLRWLQEGLVRAGLEPSVLNLAVCWHLGLEGGKRRLRAGRSTWYADSIRNIYNP